MSDEALPRNVTYADMLRYAKKLRIKVYYDIGGSDESDREATVREARCAALLTQAEAIDETFGFNSELTQEDLSH